MPVTNGLVGYYNAESWSGTQWTDLSGAGNHATVWKGTMSLAATGINGEAYLYGGQDSGMTFPQASAAACCLRCSALGSALHAVLHCRLHRCWLAGELTGAGWLARSKGRLLVGFRMPAMRRNVPVCPCATAA